MKVEIIYTALLIATCAGAVNSQSFKSSDNNDDVTDRMLEDAKSKGTFHRLKDLNDPKPGFAFRRVSEDGNVEVVFVS